MGSEENFAELVLTFQQWKIVDESAVFDVCVLQQRDEKLICEYIHTYNEHQTHAQSGIYYGAHER